MLSGSTQVHNVVKDNREEFDDQMTSEDFGRIRNEVEFYAQQDFVDAEDK